MATEAKKLEKTVLDVLNAMKAKGLISEEMKWTWQDQRNLLCSLAVRAMEHATGKPLADEAKQKFAAKWTEFVGDGYMVESSNGGKVFAGAGFCAKAQKAEEAKAAVVV